MCKRRETRIAQSIQDSAAEALAAACHCGDGIGQALAKVYNDTVNEEIPQRLKELLGGLR